MNRYWIGYRLFCLCGIGYAAVKIAMLPIAGYSVTQNVGGLIICLFLVGFASYQLGATDEV